MASLEKPLTTPGGTIRPRCGARTHSSVAREPQFSRHDQEDERGNNDAHQTRAASGHCQYSRGQPDSVRDEHGGGSRGCPTRAGAPDRLPCCGRLSRTKFSWCLSSMQTSCEANRVRPSPTPLPAVRSAVTRVATNAPPLTHLP